MTAARRTHPAAWPVDSRGQALALLSAILEDRTPLDVALRKMPGLEALSVRDRAFARLLTMTVLRRMPQLDRLIDAQMAKPLPVKQLRVRNVLRVATAQLVFLDTPSHAAVNSAVELARAVGMGGMRGLINAVLRKIAAGTKSTQQRMINPGENTPAWLWQSWNKAYGEITATAIAAAHLVEPPLDLTVRNAADAGTLAAELDARLLPTGSLRYSGGGAIGGLAGFDRGIWWVQDAAAALPVQLFGDINGSHVIDLCAAPGGKTAQLAAAGARVTAVDIAPARLETVAQNLSRLDLAADLIVADAASWQPPEPADYVLLDAPCSATGTLRRHPDIAWLKAPRDVTATVAMQDRLLNAAFGMLKPGGVLVYTVCSLQPEEGLARINALLESNTSAKRIPICTDEIPGIEGQEPAPVTPAGDLRTLPCHFAEHGGLDGFYAARLRKE